MFSKLTFPKAFLIKSLAFCLLVLIAHSESSDDDEPCFIEGQSRLQLAWILDRTQEYVHRGSKEMDITGRIAIWLASTVGDSYPGSEYAVTSYSDYPNSAIPPRGPRTTKELEMENCCKPFLNFTSDKKTVFKTIKGLKHSQSGNAESALTCLLFTAESTSIGWASPSDYFAVKFIIIVVNEENTEVLGNPGHRTEPLGDGTDTCSTRKPPTDPYHVVETTLKRQGISVIGLFDPNPLLEVSPLEIWKDIMSHIDVPYWGFMRKAKDTPEKVKNIIGEQLAKKTGKIECVWLDPPAYNTLGY